MIRNFALIAIRNFLRHRIFSFIHITGLSIGISAALVIYLIVHHESSFDKFEPDGDRIFRVVQDINFNGTVGHGSAVAAPLATAVESEITGVEASVPVMQFQGDSKVNVTVLPDAGKPIVFKKQPDVVFTNPSYFQLIPFRWLSGEATSSLREPFSVVLTESRARTYFPSLASSAIIGKQLQYGDDLAVTVTGVISDLDQTSDFTAREFISYSTISKTNYKNQFMMNEWNDWMAYSQLYIKINNAANKTSIEQQLNKLIPKYIPKMAANKSMSLVYALQPLSDIHFNMNYSGLGQSTTSISTLLGLTAISIFLLLLACINYTNLTTAQASNRAKEIGIRKTIGSSRKQLVVQFLCETFFLTTIATILSVSITPLLLQSFSDFIPSGINFDLLNDPSIILFLTGLIIMLSFLSGFYPAMVLSGYRPSQALKNQWGATTRSGGVRKVLTVSQFVIAQVFVIGAFMVTKQIHFSLNKDLGFKKEAIINFEVPFDTVADHRIKLLNEISQLEHVQRVSTGFSPPAMEGAAFSNITYKDTQYESNASVQIRMGDAEYIPLYGIELVAGRNVNSGPHVDEALINENYAKEIGFKNAAEAIGKELTFFNKKKVPIVGVMKDFHPGSFHMPIGPIVFHSRTNGTFFHVSLESQRSAGDWQAAIGKIKNAYQQIYPDSDFTFSFFNESIERMYRQEQNISYLLNWAMGLSILISCLGLLGLVIYTSVTRTKEIGIRKILGATVSNIVSILSVEFIKLILIAYAIALPIAWWFVNRWLESFAYRTEMSWWVFALCGVGLLAVAVLTLSAQVIKTARNNPVESLRSE